MISLEYRSLRLQYSREIDLPENLIIVHITLLVEGERYDETRGLKLPATTPEGRYGNYRVFKAGAQAAIVLRTVRLTAGSSGSKGGNPHW